MTDDPIERGTMNPAQISRRQALVGGGAVLVGIAALAACSDTTKPATGASPLTTAQPNATAPSTAQTADQALAATSPATTVAAATTVAPPTTVAAAPGGPAAYVNHGPTTIDNVALTFHLGGDPALVTQLLDLLKANGVRSTLFAIGDWLTAHPELGHRAVADGHELGNHTKSHQSMLKLSEDRVRAEIVGGGQALMPFIGSIGKWFRPSGTDVPTQLILDEAGLAGYAVSVGYDIDSRDFTEPGASAVVSTVNAALHPGAIVSLHFGHKDTIKALPKILDQVQTLRLVPVTITGLLG